MSPSSSPLQRPSLLLVLFAVLHVSPLHADDYGMALRYGEAGGSYHGSGISLRLPAWWSRNLESWTATLSPQLELTQFRYDGGQPGPRRVWEGGALALFRIARAGGAIRPYAEAGLGLTAFNRTTLGGKDISSSFQFTEQLGLGLLFAERWSVGWRYSHYSNGDIKMPNDGIDMQQIEVGVSF